VPIKGNSLLLIGRPPIAATHTGARSAVAHRRDDLAAEGGEVNPYQHRPPFGKLS
jgi:1,6-anhydro-N-acetylmuramate kinase